MTKLMKKPTKTISITTKTGDLGKTSLANGQRLTKSNQIFEILGSIDELNSWLGLVAAKLHNDLELDRIRANHLKSQLFKLQRHLFILSAEIAQSPKIQFKVTNLRQLERFATQLEARLNDNWWHQFVLPGGTEIAAQIDVARTVCRRCERRLVNYTQQAKTRPVLLKYLNRLSDYLYLLRSFINHSLNYQEQEFDSKL